MRLSRETVGLTISAIVGVIAILVVGMRAPESTSASESGKDQSAIGQSPSDLNESRRETAVEEHPLVAAALERTNHQVRYDGKYVAIEYPMGDVPADTGVCTDVVIRSYRALGVDLQQLVHEDMAGNFAEYPANWGLSAPDPNIDHRRVPNLRRFFERHGTSLAVSTNREDFLPGDLVTSIVAGNLPHIVIVVDRIGLSGDRMIVHNIGSGPQLEDRLFEFPITGHYRFTPNEAK